METSRQGGTGSGRVFSKRTDRLAAAWRAVRCVGGTQGEQPNNLLDCVVEPFVREIGLSLQGREGSAWSRSTGVLRLSAARGARGLYEEFAALRRCLLDAVEVLQGSPEDRAVINAAIDDAVDSSVALCEQLLNRDADGPRVPFGGLVVEYFEPSLRPAPAGVDDTNASMH